MRSPYIRGIRSMVIKVGTSVLTRNGRFDHAVIASLAKQVSAFLRKGVRVSIVSSGAIGAGMTILRFKERPKSMEGLQAAAAVGQRYLMQCYEEAFSKKGFSTAQVLLTWDDLASRKRFMNAKRTLTEIQKWGLVPVINENDTVATDEIRFGDNDRLSSLLSILVEADVQVILSNTNGLYRGGNHGQEEDRIPVVRKMDEAVFAHVKDRKNSFTVGGMDSKLRAVRMSTSSGIPVFLVHGRDRDVLMRLFAGEDVGTFFMPDLKKRRDRKNWIRHYVSHVQK
ncbi:MAG TPA: glutamate 5-kinase [Candidatus Eisenbacteria bacterium]|nr:glutamate 5-kinase [Candidatus Eisenbacteria bacterium]